MIRTANIRFIYILANKPQFFFIIFPAVLYLPLKQYDNKYRAKLARKLKYYVSGNYSPSDSVGRTTRQSIMDQQHSL